MRLGEPIRWVLFLSVVTGIALAIGWGCPFDRGWHFYVYHDWFWPWLVLGAVCLVGGVLWLFLAQGPTVLNQWRWLRHILTASLFVATFAAVWGLTLGLNAIGDLPPKASLSGVISGFKSLKTKAVPFYDREVALIQVENGPEIEMPVRVLMGLGVKISFEGKVCVMLHRGNFFDWGWILPPPCANDGDWPWRRRPRER